MSIYLDPTGQPTFGIGICARCSRKFLLAELSPDPNSPGLMVCRDDRDEFDPYRLPARQTEDIALPFTRPDVPLTIPEEVSSVDTTYYLVTEDEDPYITEDDINMVVEAAP